MQSDNLFQIVMVDKIRKTKIITTLKDKDGNEVQLKEMVEGLTDWVYKNIVSKEENNCQKQIFPLMGNAATVAMTKLYGQSISTYFLTSNYIRYALFYAMTIGFYLSTWFQKKGIKVHTQEESLTEQDIESYERINQLSESSIYLSMLNMDPKEIVKKLYEQGHIKDEDLEKLDLSYLIEKNKKDN